MSFDNTAAKSVTWSANKKLLFRFAFIFLLLLTIPFDYRFYSTLFSASALNLHITGLLALAGYQPDYFSEFEKTPWSIDSYSSWGVTLIIALVVTGIWTLYSDKNKIARNVDYNKLYYWLRVILRYRLGIALIAYGVIKLFPLQMPFPSLSNLYTNYGDFLPWKIYFHTVGVAPNYESFLGFVEVAAGVLLFFRNKVTFGTGIILGFIGNVLFANFSYGIGGHVLATYIVMVSIFLFAHDIPRLFNLLVREKPTSAEKFEPDFSAPWLKNLRYGLKGGAFLLTALLIFSALHNFSTAPYLLPTEEGLSKAYGFYNVKHFVLNGDTLPYSRTDVRRWQNVIFEKWPTISLKTAEPVKVDRSIVQAGIVPNLGKVYESSGVGDRRYFDYTIDSFNQRIRLQNKNALSGHETFDLVFSRPSDSTIILRGTNQKYDSITAYLERIDRKYMLLEGRRKPVKL